MEYIPICFFEELLYLLILLLWSQFREHLIKWCQFRFFSHSSHLHYSISLPSLLKHKSLQYQNGYDLMDTRLVAIRCAAQRFKNVDAFALY